MNPMQKLKQIWLLADKKTADKENEELDLTVCFNPGQVKNITQEKDDYYILPMYAKYKDWVHISRNTLDALLKCAAKLEKSPQCEQCNSTTPVNGFLCEYHTVEKLVKNDIEQNSQ